MKKLLLALALALACTIAPATQWLFSNADVAVTVKDNVRCTNPRILKMLELMNAPKELVWAEASIAFKGAVIDACAAVHEGQVVVVDENGDGGVIPQDKFHALKEV